MTSSTKKSLDTINDYSMERFDHHQTISKSISALTSPSPSPSIFPPPCRSSPSRRKSSLESTSAASSISQLSQGMMMNSELDHFKQTLQDHSTVHGSLSKISEDVDTLSPNRWYVKKKQMEYDNEITQYYEKQCKVILHSIRDMNIRIDNVVSKIGNAMKWSSSIPELFQKLVIDYSNHLITVAMKQEIERRNMFHSEFHQMSSHGYHSQTNDNYSSNSNNSNDDKNKKKWDVKGYTESKKWHEIMHEKWLQEQINMEKKKQTAREKIERLRTSIGTSAPKYIEVEIEIADDFEEKTKLISWLKHYIGTDLEKKIEAIKMLLVKLKSLLDMKNQTREKLENETLLKVEAMIIKKENNIRWTIEKYGSASINHRIQSSNEDHSSNHDQNYRTVIKTTITFARDKYWSIWFLAKNGLTEQLIRYLSNPNHLKNIDLPDPDFGFTALHYASKANHLLNVCLLLSHNANVHMKAPDGRTALHFCAAYCNSGRSKETLLRLLSCGDMNYHLVQDNYGFTAIDLALQNQNTIGIETLYEWKCALLHPIDDRNIDIITTITPKSNGIIPSKADHEDKE